MRETSAANRIDLGERSLLCEMDVDEAEADEAGDGEPDMVDVVDVIDDVVLVVVDIKLVAVE